tara:strand:+ start:4860 stop:5555 length:696 start_codon:yes stop_codon:yes gene_type:complete
MESKINLTKAILEVMSEVKGVEKNLSVGNGQNSYKGVSDQDVKKIIGSSMQKNGLTILTINIDPTVRVDRWEHTDQWGTKMKQSIFTETKVTYLLMHVSGESMQLVGYGHGVDSQDKSAGKATTYALKYALLYAFLVPTGSIDDSDTNHSEDKETPSKPKKATKKISLNKERFDSALKQIEDKKFTFEKLKSTFILTKDQKDIVKELEDEEEMALSLEVEEDTNDTKTEEK